MRKASSRPRGAATVEMALSLIVIMPIFMYAIFLDDLLRFRLDLEEAVASSAWDYHPVDYTDAPDIGAVWHNARLMWCDHSSAYDSYDHNYDCESTAHHTAVGAHVCWLQPEAEQITCDDPNKDVGASYQDPTASHFHGSFTNGGLIACHGTEAVLNYFLPQQLFQEFSRTVMTNRKEYHGDVHSNAQGAGDLDVYLLKGMGPRFDGQQPKFGVVTDSWALDDGWGPSGDSNNIKPGDKSGKFYDRVKEIYQYNLGYPFVVMDGAQFIEQLLSNELIDPAFLPPSPLVDDPFTPNVASLHSDTQSPRPQDASQPPTSDVTEEGSTASYYATPWQDWDQDLPEKTWQDSQRGGYYMGHKDPETD